MPHTGVGTKGITFDHELFFGRSQKGNVFTRESVAALNNFFDVLMRRLFGVAFFSKHHKKFHLYSKKIATNN